MLFNICVCSVLVCWLAAPFAEANCGPCFEAPKIYEELQCEGRMGQGDCCNTRYNCSTTLGKLRDASKCVLKDRLYEIGEKVPLNLLPSCALEATCTSSPAGPTFSIVREEVKSVPDGCLPQYTLENLCNPVKFVCGAEEKEKLLKCSLRGKEYYDGELFTHPSFSVFSAVCYKCLCNSTFDSDSSIPSMSDHCRKFDCGIEIFHADKIRNGCVPVHEAYSVFDNEPAKCCPSDWVCPDTNKDKTYALDTEGASVSCHFGEKTFSFRGDDELTFNDKKCRKCFCKTPPALTCYDLSSC